MSINIRETKSVDPSESNFKPTHRLSYLNEAGERETMDVVATNNDKGEVYDLKGWIEDEPLRHIDYSSEGGWGLYGYPAYGERAEKQGWSCEWLD